MTCVCDGARRRRLASRAEAEAEASYVGPCLTPRPTRARESFLGLARLLVSYRPLAARSSVAFVVRDRSANGCAG